MIPLKIQLKNFLSYGAELQTIDFSAYNLICLCGKNGHGKSALLDAITWALWGTARKVLGESKADVGLLRLGQTHMQVILDFECNGQRYRVRREFAKAYGKPYAVLEFGMLNPDTGELLALTDKTIRATQAKIIATLSLTAESFINSAFIRQGHANEFSQKAPKDRKKIVANILGLTKYDELRRLACEQMKGLQLKRQAFKAALELLEQELVIKAEIAMRVHEGSTLLDVLVVQEAALKKRQQELEQQRVMVENHEQKRHILAVQQEQSIANLHAKQTRLRTLLSAWRAMHKQLRSVDYALLDQERQSLRAQLAQHQDRLTQRLATQEKLLVMREKLQQHEMHIGKEHEVRVHQEALHAQKLRFEENTIKAHVSAYEATLQHQEKLLRDYTQEQETLRVQLQSAAALTANYERVEQQFMKRKNYYHLFIAQGNWVTQQLEELSKKQLLVQDETNPSCPVCEQNLSAARKRFLKKSFEEQVHFLTARLARLKMLIARLKTLLVEQNAVRESLRAEQQRMMQKAVRNEALHKECAQLLIAHAASAADYATACHTHVELKQKIAQHEKHCAQIREQLPVVLAQDEYYCRLKNEVQQLHDAMQSVAYDDAQHQHSTKRLHMIEQQIVDYANTQQYQALQEQRRKDSIELCQELKALKKAVALQEQLLRDHMAQALDKQLLLDAMRNVEHEMQQLRTHKETLLQQQGQVKHQMTKLLKTEQDIQDRSKEIALLDEGIQEYELIASAMGKDGLQALLIEESIPEIEQEANMLLAQLTDNQTHIFIESLKDLKSGGTKETLDIRVSDSMGVRPYELFSGGEAFRIDFALRVGIAKLLARRAGTSLQTLIIDEGFGSQDEEGLSLIMDAIHRIQGNFSKIIIVSHLNTMKNQFPVHFLVQKMAHGSHVQVIEQG